MKRTCDEMRISQESIGVEASHQNAWIERVFRFVREQLMAFRLDDGFLKGWSEEIFRIVVILYCFSKGFYDANNV